MATIAEANQINTLLRYITNTPRPGGRVPTSDEAKAAACYLAGRANKALAAGLVPDAVADAWDHRRRSASPGGAGR